MRWYLEPDAPLPLDTNPLVNGVYRIRTFEGTHLMTMPSSESSVVDPSVFVKQQDKSGAYQRV